MGIFEPNVSRIKTMAPARLPATKVFSEQSRERYPLPRFALSASNLTTPARASRLAWSSAASRATTVH
jgi:hypothetical protein